MVKVTYNPQHTGDPHHVEVGGRCFKAGEAVDLDARTSDHKHFVEQAKGNPWFTVDGHERAEEQGVPENPQTPEEYRRYAIDWIGKVQKARDLDRRWNKEGDMRDALGWGTDDQNLIDPILEPRREQLRRGED